MCRGLSRKPNVCCGGCIFSRSFDPPMVIESKKHLFREVATYVPPERRGAGLASYSATYAPTSFIFRTLYDAPRLIFPGSISHALVHVCLVWCIFAPNTILLTMVNVMYFQAVIEQAWCSGVDQATIPAHDFLGM